MTPNRTLLALALLAAMAFPSTAAALELEIVNESGHGPEDVYVTVVGADFEVTGAANDEPTPLSAIPAQTLTVDKLVSGRVYISYGAGVSEGVPFDSPTRFDWAELTVTPSSSDVANLTAVDQFGIGMRLDTYGGGETHLETVGSANSDTVFAALQQIPGGAASTVRDGNNDILRVLSPNHSAAYPDLGEYVRSMSGQAVTLRTAFFGEPFTTSAYTGTFAVDGSIELNGTTNPGGAAPASLDFDGADLIADVYTGAGTPNNMEGAIRRDLLAAFSTGFWGGRYGNDALSFCSDPITTAQGSWCPHGFNQPAFGDARLALSPYPTCEQYAAVINQYSDVYGNPYSDAAKKVTVGLDQPGTGGAVETLRLTILPDSGDAHPVAGGNAECGAAAPAAPPAAPAAAPAAAAGAATVPRLRFRLFKRARVRGSWARVGRVFCGQRCGRVRLVAKRGGRVVGRRGFYAKGSRPHLKLRLTGRGRRALARRGRLRAKLIVRVKRPGRPNAVRRRGILLLPRR